MNNLEIYQQQINTIFSCLEKLGNSLKNQDNLNFINNLNEYKKDAIDFSNLINDLSNKERTGTKQ